MNILKKIRRIIALYIKKRNLKKQLKHYSNTNISGKFSKTIISDGANVTLNTKSQEQINKINSEINQIVESCSCNPEKLLGYIKAAKTPIYTIKNTENLLKKINEEEGFIPEKKGWVALYLSFITMNGIHFSTPDMFIFNKHNPEKYLVLYNFYKWYSKKAGLDGFDQKSQEIFKKYYKNINKINTIKLSLKEIISIQEAMERDNEAINFTLKYEKEHEISKKLSDKLNNKGDANI